MKRIFYFMFLALLTLSCSKPQEVDELFGADPDSRIADTLSYLKKTLIEAPHGWKAYMTTEYSGGYGFYMQFSENDRLKMVADLNDQTAVEVKESTYRIRQIMAATLSFDTYNYVTMLQDPAPGSYGGEAGVGMGSDVEFDYVKTNGDTLFFEGRKFYKPLILVKATEGEEESYISGDYLNEVNKAKVFFRANPLTSIIVNDIETEIAFNFPSKKVSIITAEGDGSFSSSSTSFCNSINGLEIIGGISLNGVNVNRFIWKDQNSLVGFDAMGNEYPLKINTESVVPYLTALGTRFTTIQVPDVAEYGGWSTDFISRKAAAKAGINRWYFDEGENFILKTIDFKFQVVNNRMSIVFNAVYGPNEEDFSLTYNYTYTEDNGKFKFTIGTPGGNDAALYGDVKYLLQERINVDTFELGYYVNSETGEVMSQFKSIEHPDFYFTGLNL